MGSAEASSFRSQAYGALHTFVASAAHHTIRAQSRCSKHWACDSPAVNLFSFPNLSCVKTEASLPIWASRFQQHQLHQQHTTHQLVFIGMTVTSSCWNTFYFLLHCFLAKPCLFLRFNLGVSSTGSFPVYPLLHPELCTLSFILENDLRFTIPLCSLG